MSKDSKNSLKIGDKKLKVQYVEISLLKPAEYNPRKWDDSAEKKLKQSIKKFGVVDPIIANCAVGRENVVIGGHFRLATAKKMGFKEIPVVFVNISDLKKEKELNLRLNRNTGEWDLEILKSFDIGLLLDVGFDDSDLSKIWDDALETEDDEFDLEKEIAEIKTPQTKPGDLYQLGNHRLICGDSTNPSVIKRLVGKEKAQMLYCDPPYNISLDYNKGVGTKGKYGGKTKDDMSRKEYKAFLAKTLANGINAVQKNCHVFYWCDQNYVGLVQSIFRKAGLNNKRVCLWVKNNFNVTPQIAFNKAYEPCVYAVRGNPYLAPCINNLGEILNKDISVGNRTIDDIVDLFDLWLAKRIPGQEYEHPTQKPPTLHEKPLRRCTKPGDIVMDLFGGSGSTLIACEQMRRTCFMVEIDPVFCDVIVRRYELVSGKSVQLIK